MTSAPVLLVVLEGENAVEKIEKSWVQLITEAAEGLSESFMQNQLKQTRYTEVTHWLQQIEKSITFSKKMKS